MAEEMIEGAIGDNDPLDWLPEKERSMMASILNLIEHSLPDGDLKDDVIGGILISIDEWGKAKALRDAPKGPAN